MPDVIEIRKKIYSERHDYQMIGSSVTDHHWLDQIPIDRPVPVVAEGLMAYITKEEVLELFNQIAEKFSHGEIIFYNLIKNYVGISCDNYATWHIKRNQSSYLNYTKEIADNY